MVTQLVLSGDRIQECQRAGCRAARAAAAGVSLLTQLGAVDVARDRARLVREVVEARVETCDRETRGQICPLRTALKELPPTTEVPDARYRWRRASPTTPVSGSKSP